MNSMKKYVAEFIGTLVLVLFGCGVAVLHSTAAGASIGVVGIALSFGLAIVSMAYAIGPISGCHVNPAVSFAMFINKKMDTTDFIGYVIAQVIGAIVGAAILTFIISSAGLTALGTGLGTNGFGAGYGIGINASAAIVVEIVLTFVFVLTILGVTSSEKTANVAGIVIGLTLVFVHLLGITLTGTSVNPARSIGPALFVGGAALKQLWVFIVAPLIGSALAAYTWKYFKK